MFRIVCDPSSGIIEQYLTEIRGGSLMFVVCLVGVWQRHFEPVACVYGTTGCPSPSYRTRCLFTYEAISQRTAEDYPLLIYLRDHIPEDS